MHINFFAYYCVKKKKYKNIRRSFEFSFIMGNPIPALNSMGTGMEKKVSTIVKWGWG
jgi:hypothetical protein